MKIQNNDSNNSKGVQLTNEEKEIISRLRKDQTVVFENSRKPITHPPVLFTFNNEPVIRRNTLTIIKGQTGAHKSRVAEMLVSMLIAQDGDKKTGLGFTCVEKDPTHSTYADTERNTSDQLPEAVQRIQKIAGYEFDAWSKRFSTFTLINVKRVGRLESILTIIKHQRMTVPADQHLVIVLDVLSDVIGDFNSLEETYRLIDELVVYMNEFNVSFIGVIHENPWTTKARGHLGTEAVNKASTVIQIVAQKRCPDRFWINIEKTRSSKKPKSSLVYYDEISGILQLAKVSDCDSVAPTDEKLVKVITFLERMENDTIGQTELATLTGIKDSTLSSKIKTLIDEKIIIEREGTDYLVTKHKPTGHKAFIKLTEVSDEEAEDSKQED